MKLLKGGGYVGAYIREYHRGDKGSLDFSSNDGKSQPFIGTARELRKCQAMPVPWVFRHGRGEVKRIPKGYGCSYKGLTLRHCWLCRFSCNSCRTFYGDMQVRKRRTEVDT